MNSSTSNCALVEGGRGNERMSLAYVIKGEDVRERRFTGDECWLLNDMLDTKQCGLPIARNGD